MSSRVNCPAGGVETVRLMSQSAGLGSSFKRRRGWTREEWIVAFDACPKDRQRYGSASRDVLEVAYLINRTPAAVSRSFANIWAAMTGGREGLRNFAELCGEVVSEYGSNYAQLHRDALRIRHDFLERALAPRIELYGNRGGVIADHDLRQFARTVSNETHLPRHLFVAYHREGSFIEGTLLVSNLLSGIAGGVYLLREFIQWMERRVERNPALPRFEVTRTRTWVALGNGDTKAVERMVISFYLPSMPLSRLDDQSAHALASYLDAALGVSRIPIERSALPTRPPGRARIQSLERRTGARLARLPPHSLAELDALIKVVETSGFRRAARRLRQINLDQYNQ